MTSSHHLAEFIPQGTPFSVTPATAALTTATFAPSVVVNHLLVPSTATLALSTFAPLTVINSILTPDTASLTLTGFAPLAPIGFIFTPDTASLTLTGFAPLAPIGFIFTPDTASLTLSTFAPFVDFVIPSNTGVVGNIPDWGTHKTAGWMAPAKYRLPLRPPPFKRPW